MPRLDGSIEAEDLDAPAVVAAAIGVPRAARERRRLVDRSDCLERRSALDGRIGFKAQRAAFAPWLVAQNLSGAVRFNGAEVDVREHRGRARQGPARRPARGVERRGRCLGASFASALADAELGAIVASADRPATSGRLALQAELEGSGRSPAAFIGSLAGFGHVSIEQARLVGLNPQVFGAVTRAVELGIPTEGTAMREFVTGALDNAGLPVSKASAAISISAGQARLRDIAITRRRGGPAGHRQCRSRRRHARCAADA